MASQIGGNTIANIMEVEANTHAARVTLRDLDYGSLGIYALGANNGTSVMAAGLAANSPIFSARWGDATKICLLRRVIFSAGVGATGFTAGFTQFDLFAARSFSVADTGGVSVLPTGNINKLRTSMGTTAFSDMRISQTATLTAGSRTKDANPLGSIVGSVSTAAGAPMIAPIPLFDMIPGMHPLLLVQNEGIVIQANVPATGTWSFAVSLVWTELPTTASY